MQRRAGFTFMEIMIVVALLGIIGALAVPMFSATDLDKLRSAAGVLVADLDFARVESVSHSDDPRVVVFDLVNHSYYVAPSSNRAAPVTDPMTKQAYYTRFGGPGGARELGGVTIEKVVAGSDNVVQFGAYGQTSHGTATQILLSNKAGKILVTVDPITGETSTSAISSSADVSPDPSDTVVTAANYQTVRIADMLTTSPF